MKRLAWVFAAITIAMISGFVLLEWKNTESTGKAQEKDSRQKQGTVKPESASPPTVDVAPVELKTLDRTIRLPGELWPYLSVDLYPKVSGILDWIGVDRGSRVTRGQVIIRLTAPELKAQRAEAEAKLQSDRATLERLRAAAETPGVVAPNDLEVSQKTVQADLARVQSLKDLEAYLTIAAPFDGIVTERHVHPGALVGPGGGTPMVRIEQLSRLRLVVAVPEPNVAEIAAGKSVTFIVPAYPGRTFRGIITRVAHSVDAKTRTMPVELDVENSAGKLAAGMFPEVEWPVRRTQPTLFVPAKAIVTTTEKTFVIRVRDETAEWVTVKRGASVGDLAEIFGELQANDQVVFRATDELRSGMRVNSRHAESSSSTH
jgi:RND family efflux transporter MFP subunit